MPSGDLRSRQRRQVSSPPKHEDQEQDRVREGNVSPTSAANPAIHIHGDSAAIARPPSSGTTGSRLKRLRKKPVNASARKQVAVGRDRDPGDRRRAEAAEDRAGEADARLRSALPPNERAQITAPRNGMNIGAEP